MVVRVCLLIAIQDWNASIRRAIYGHAATVEASLVACCKPKIEKRCICDTCSFMNKCLVFPVYESHHAPPHHSWLFVFETCLQSHTHTWLTWDFGIPASRKFWCSLAPPKVMELTVAASTRSHILREHLGKMPYHALWLITGRGRSCRMASLPGHSRMDFLGPYGLQSGWC